MTATTPEIDIDQVRQELSVVLASESFRNSAQLSAFLTYVVERALVGVGSRIKAYAIATEALGRPASFDPHSDSTVRVIANRLRSALQRFYEKSGRLQSIVIELLPGSYTPQFRHLMIAGVRTHSSVDGNLRDGPAQNIQSIIAAGAARKNAHRLLILEDDADIRRLVHSVAESSGFAVVATAQANEFWAAYKVFQPTYIILDLMLNDTDGLEIMQELGRLSATCQITLLSGVDPRLLRASENIGRGHGLNIVASISKPFDIGTLSDLLNKRRQMANSETADEILSGPDMAQLVLYFQPQISWSVDGKSAVSGLEALVRWIHPVKGTILPDNFVPLTEKNGLIVAMTERVLDLVVEQMVRLNSDHPHMTIAMNLSAALLDDYLLPDKLAAKLDDAGLAHSRLTLEITETVAAHELSGPIDAITRLRLKGFTLSIDDFGTGHSSLMRLLRMPFNELKIDKSFVEESLANEDARLIVRTVIDLARNLGLRACAEGVETEECLQLLRGLGCNYAQGHLFSKPVPAAELAHVLKRLSRRQW